MDIFSSLLSFPTNIYFYVLIFLALYWAVVSLGLLDLEILDLDTDTDGEGAIENFLSKLGLDGVPLTVAITLLDIYGLSFAYLGRKYFMPLFDGILTATAAGAVTAVFALVLSIPLAAICIKPLRGAFTTHEGITKQELVGTICIVTTSRVNENFGQAETPDGMRFNVRATTPNTMQRGTKVALIELINESGCFSVVTETELMAMASS